MLFQLFKSISVGSALVTKQMLTSNDTIKNVMGGINENTFGRGKLIKKGSHKILYPDVPYVDTITHKSYVPILPIR